LMAGGIVLIFHPKENKRCIVFPEEEVKKVLENDQITQPVAEKLLTIYVAENDWWPHVGRLYKQLERKHGPEEAKNLVRRAVAFTILLPAFDRTTRIDMENPENHLFWGQKFHQFNDRDWFAELQKVIRRDQEITEYRRKALSLGVIDPIDYQPYSRQAFKWLCGKAEDSGVELTPDLKNKFRQLVMTYGGAVVSYIFENHRGAVDKIVNWRSGYFFERTIFDVYSLDQVLKIKKAELEKTNSKWIKKLRG